MPYQNDKEYLTEVEIYIDLVLMKFFRDKEALTEKEQKWLSMEETKYNGFPTDYLKQPNLWKQQISRRYEMSALASIEIQVEEMRTRLCMDEKVTFVLLFVAFCMIKREYQQFVELCTGQKYPDFVFCQQLLSQNSALTTEIYRYFARVKKQLQFLFPIASVSRNMMMEPLVGEDRLMDMIWGENKVLNTGIPISECLSPFSRERYLCRAKEIAKLNSFVGSSYPLFFLTGERGSGRKALAKHFCKKHGKGLVILDLQTIIGLRTADIRDALQVSLLCAKRECLWNAMPLLIDGTEGLSKSDRQWLISFVEDELKWEVQLIFFVEEKRQQLDEGENRCVIELEPFDETSRCVLWKYFLAKKSVAEDVDITLLANTFFVNPGQMKQVVDALAGSERIGRGELYRNCYAVLDHALGDKAEKISSSFSWDDLKLDDKNLQILREICDSVKYRDVVMNTWKFKQKVPYGAGMTVLFAGPPGTGKTMAAHVLANELGMELYRVDMSQVMDKYVGETEKNLRRIFKEAQKSNSILFFDEADAVFHKRMEATGANERYANIESSILLQYIEEYTGISILATNNVSFIDVAFLRRFKFYLKFHEPDAKTRLAIWTNVFPKDAPVADEVDFRELAEEFEFTGAIIKNVALYAAYLAAARGTAIELIDIVKAVCRELEKNNGINLVKDKLGSFAYLYDVIVRG